MDHENQFDIVDQIVVEQEQESKSKNEQIFRSTCSDLTAFRTNLLRE